MSMCRKHILLVDDKKDILQPLAEGLRASDTEFEVLTAENGRKALDIFRSGHRIDLLVTDLEMPVMDGFVLLAHLKRDYPATPAIVLTGHITPEIESLLRMIGDYHCLQKPVGIGKLHRKILDELRLHSAHDENTG